MTHYVLMAVLGIVLFLGARYLDRTVAQNEPELAVIEPAIPGICSAAKYLGVMISIASLGAAVCVALT